MFNRLIQVAMCAAFLALVPLESAGFQGPAASGGIEPSGADLERFADASGMRLDSSSSPSPRNGFELAYDSQSDRVIMFGGFDGTVALADTWAYAPSTNRWTSMKPSVAPPARRLFAMAYDAQSDLVVIFGGINEVNMEFGDTWTYDFNTNTWIAKNPSPAPPVGSGQKMAYDAESGRIVLHGGDSDPSGTWLYDANANAWTHVFPSPTPALWDHAAAYDSASDRTVVFGGVASAGTQNETWAYDVNGNAWTNLNPPTRPSARWLHSLAYDAKSDRVVLYGGWTGSVALGDTWVFDLRNDTWTNMNPVVHPSSRIGHRMAYDMRAHRVVLFGGVSAVGGVRNNETWAYDFNTNRWTQVTDLSLSPSPRAGHGMAYDSESDRSILFGGEAVGNETWAYDANVNSWTRMSPPFSPEARFGHGGATVYSSGIDRIILFGGFTSVFTNDMWSYDFNADAWTQLAPGVSPSPRAGHSMAYDAESDRIVLFGGDTGILNNETWAYSPQTGAWTRMNPAAAPSPRKGFSTVYDSATDRIIGFGGEAGGPNNETWTYDLNNDTWTRMTPNVSPDARRGHRLAYDAQSDRVILFSGFTGVRNDDTWAYDYRTDTWTKMNPPAAPSGRVRHQMVYDVESDRIVLFGGEWPPQGVPNGETWAYDFDGNTWTPMIVPPAEPQALTASAGPHRVDLVWRTPSFPGSDPITGYRVYRHSEATNFSLLAVVGVASSFRDTTVADGGTYVFQVTAVNDAGEGSPSNAASITVPDTTNTPPSSFPLWIAAAGGIGAIALVLAVVLLIRRRKKTSGEGGPPPKIP